MKEIWLWAIIALQFSVIIAMAAHFMNVPWYWWVMGAMSIIIALLYAAAAYFSRAEIASRDPIVKMIDPPSPIS